MLADGEDDEDVDLSDSDDDATWTPFKEKESKEGGGKDGKVDGGAHANGPKKRPNYMDDLDDDDGLAEEDAPAAKSDKLSVELWDGRRRCV